MYDILLFASLIAGFIVLNVWILPLFGIQTCMSGACRVPHVEQDASLNAADQAARLTKTEISARRHRPDLGGLGWMGRTRRWISRELRGGRGCGADTIRQRVDDSAQESERRRRGIADFGDFYTAGAHRLRR